MMAVELQILILFHLKQQYLTICIKLEQQKFMRQQDKIEDGYTKIKFRVLCSHLKEITKNSFPPQVPSRLGKRLKKSVLDKRNLNLQNQKNLQNLIALGISQLKSQEMTKGNIEGILLQNKKKFSLTLQRLHIEIGKQIDSEMLKNAQLFMRNHYSQNYKTDCDARWQSYKHHDCFQQLKQDIDKIFGCFFLEWELPEKKQDAKKKRISRKKLNEANIEESIRNEEKKEANQSKFIEIKTENLSGQCQTEPTIGVTESNENLKNFNGQKQTIIESRLNQQIFFLIPGVSSQCNQIENLLIQSTLYDCPLLQKCNLCQQRLHNSEKKQMPGQFD